MNIDELKSQWQSIGDIPAERSAVGHRSDHALDSGRPRMSDLKRRYGRICLMMIGLALCNTVIFLDFRNDMPTLTAVAIAYFALMGAANALLWSRIRSIDLSQLTVVEAVSRVRRVEWWTRVIRAFSFVCATGVICCLVYGMMQLYGHEMIICGLAGLVIGLPIGLAIRRRRNSILTNLTDILRETQE